MVSLDAPAQRIVTLSPHSAELVAAAGAVKQLVAVSEHSDAPQEVRQLPVVRGVARWNEEALLVLHPDLIVAPAFALPLIPARVRRQTAVFIADAPTPERIAEEIEALGTLTGHVAQARQAASGFRQKLSALSVPPSPNPPSVLVVIWNAPLYVVGNSPLINAALRRCGAVNVFGDERSPSLMVTQEAVLRANPDFIVFGAEDRLVQRWLSDWQSLPILPARLKGSMKAVNPDWLFRPGPRFTEGMAALCEVVQRSLP